MLTEVSLVGTLKERNHLKDLSLNGKAILKH
jgi:hypothetical protein